ncbi:MAG: cobalamin biosynthesis protein CobD [Caldilineaceae bacterium]|nr:cobalamin biosynthesis protein CobD [Caldilineaceae bacterium]
MYPWKATYNLLHQAIVILLALLIDFTWGDPPNRFHPVAWMGNGIAWARRQAPQTGHRAQFVYGVGLAGGGALLLAAVGWVLQALLARLPWWGRLLAEALLLKSTLALHGLSRAAMAVYQPLQRDDLSAARHQLSWHLVSRDTSRLTTAQVAAATIESVAENASDGVIAPLFFYAVGGLPAALAYRFVNTADAMLGYRDPAREWLGKASARLDDGLNLLPARLTALLILLATWVQGQATKPAWAIWRRDAHQTASPNAGHPMSAMAGALGVSLEKVGQYNLGAGQRLPGAADILHSIWLMQVAVLLATPLLLLVRLLITYRLSRMHQ